MIRGTKSTDKPHSEVEDRLKTLLAASNCEIVGNRGGTISFRHGTYLTQTAPLLPKKGVVTIKPGARSTRVDYEVQVVGFMKLWMIFFAVVFFWMIFPPIVVHRALMHHPKRFMENMMAGI